MGNFLSEMGQRGCRKGGIIVHRDSTTKAQRQDEAWHVRQTTSTLEARVRDQ